MSNHFERPTAQIYQFPIGGRHAPGSSSHAARWDAAHDDAASQTSSQQFVLASTGGYHGAAIADEAAVDETTDPTWRVS